MSDNFLFANNCRTTLAQDIPPSALSIVVHEATSPYNNFPTDNENFHLTIVDDIVFPTQIEIVKVTGQDAPVDGTITYYVDRAQENTDPQLFSTGAIVYLSATAEALDSLKNQPVERLEDINDVLLTDIEINQYLMWDGDNWVNADVSTTLEELDDTEITDIQIDHILQWDGDNWVNVPLITTLEDLDDTEITDIQVDNILQWDGDNWINVPLITTLEDLDDTEITDIQVDHILRWDGDNWVNEELVIEKNTSLAFSLGNEDGPGIPIGFAATAVSSGDIRLNGEWKVLARPAGQMQLDIRVSDFGLMPTSSDSILNGNYIEINNNEFTFGSESLLENLEIERGKVVQLYVHTSNNMIEYINLVLEGSV
jgi:hypothetical protein